MPTDHALETSYLDYYMKPTSASSYTYPPPAQPGLAAGTAVAHDATDKGTGYGWVHPTSTRFPQEPSAFGTAPTKDAPRATGAPSMYQSTSRVEMPRPTYAQQLAAKTLPQEHHTAGYATAAASSAKRLFGV